MLDAVFRERQKKELEAVRKVFVYTAIDSAPENILDILAVQFKVDWYRDDYPIETKRRVIKTAMEVRRYCGTEWAVKQAISAIYPNSEIVEWYDYNGTPGHWRLRVNITENADIAYYTIKRMESLLGYARRCTAHLEGISYLIFNSDAHSYIRLPRHGAASICPDHRHPAAKRPQGHHIRPSGLCCVPYADGSPHQGRYSPGRPYGNSPGPGRRGSGTATN